MGLPFARSKAIMAAITAFLAAGMSRAAAEAEVGPYRSRGKGKSVGHSARCVRIDQRAAEKAKNRAAHKRACR